MRTIDFARKHTIVTIVTTLLCLSVATPTLADDANLDQETTFHIAAQPLDTALLEFSDQADLQVMVAANDLEGIRTEGIQGTHTPRSALSSLLDDTGLEYQAVGSTITVSQDEEDSTSGKSRPASSQVLMARNQTSAPRNQTNETNDDDKERRKARKMEEILVTGSRIRGAQGASPVVTFTREEIDRAGFATVEEFIDKLPQNFGAGASLDTNVGRDVVNSQDVVGGLVGDHAGGTSVNLRGLGTSTTLVLLNGRRMSPSGTSARFTNISSIPVTAIERVEVLTDGASAIYGSDAIGGVINFILRDNYEGAETRLRYGVGWDGYKPEILLGQSFGKSWSGGNLLFSYEYYDSDHLANSDRDITSTQDLRRFGGTDWRVPGGPPANIVAGGQTFAIPAGQDGTALTAADFDANAPLNLFNRRSVGDIMPAVGRHSAFLHVTQDISKAELFAEAQFSTQDTLTLNKFGPFAPFTVPDTNPYFVDPTGTGLTEVTVVGYSVENDIGPEISLGKLDSSRGVLGARVNIGERWNGELAVLWSKAEGVGASKLRFFPGAFGTSLAQSDPTLAYNVFGDGPNTNPALVESLLDRSLRVGSESRNELWGFGFNVDGEVVDLPGSAGAIQVATGIEFREESLFSDTFQQTPQQHQVSDSNRDVLAVYTEFFFPLVGSANSRTGLHRLEVSVAGRYEDYSDFGSRTSPKVGLVWSPTQSLILRGTYGTSFKAPALVDLDISNPQTNTASYAGQFFVDAGFLPTTLIIRSGGSEDLKAENSTMWTAGFEWTPERINGLSLDVTYFNIDFEDRVDLPTSNAIEASNDPRFATVLLNTSPTAEEIAALVNDPRWRASFGGITTPPEDILSGAAPVGGILDMRKINLSQIVVTGVDLQLAYDFGTALGAFHIGLNGSYNFDFERRLLVTDSLVDEVDRLGRPVDFRARGSVRWSHRGWSVSSFVNYMDGYTDNVSDPVRPVDSWTTLDLTIAYNTGDDRGFFSDTRLSLTTQNVFDEDPPFVDRFGGLAYDSVNGSPLGRFLAFQITKEW